LDLPARLEIVIGYLSNIVSVRVKDDLVRGISLEDRRRQSFDGVKATFVGESQEKPVVIILEDIHWIDQTSEEFFSYLSSSVADNRIMILALHRPYYQCPWAASSSYLQIPIQPLSHAESEEMLHRMFGFEEVAQEVKELVQGKAEGNPFYMEELIMELLESGLVCEEGETCRLVDPRAETQVPATVNDVIMARIDRLDDTYKRTLQLASVIGREFAYTILEKIAEPGHKLSPTLQALQQSELIAEKSLFPELEYMFKHALTQDVAYNSLLLERRRELHSRIAAAIEEIKRESLDEYIEMIAYHYKNGDRPEKAFEYLTRAGEKAIELHSTDLARNYFEEALALAASLPVTDSVRNREQELKARLEEIPA
jgi:predicted ATPase